MLLIRSVVALLDKPAPTQIHRHAQVSTEPLIQLPVALNLKCSVKWIVMVVMLTGAETVSMSRLSRIALRHALNILVVSAWHGSRAAQKVPVTSKTVLVLHSIMIGSRVVY
jgi:hypothetical protein